MAEATTGRGRRPTGKQRDKADNAGRLWAAKYAAADTPAKVAAVEYDRVRASINDLPTRRADKAWKDLADLLTRHREHHAITTRDVHGESSHESSR